MPANHITRRRLLAGTSAAILASRIPEPDLAEGRPIFARGGKGSSAPPVGDGGTETHVNTAASATPANYPLTLPHWFPPTAVPAGYIAVPQLGGVDLTYTLVNRAPDWGDGYLKGGIFYISFASALAAGATRQVTFDIRPGTYSNTSLVTIDTVTSETDFNIQLSGCHTAMMGTKYPGNQYAHYSVRVSGGQVTGAKVQYLGSDATITDTIVQQGGGSGATISFLNKVPTITNPGSGYTLLNGTGAVSISLNTIIAGIAANGNRTGGRRIEQYAKGAACDAWKIYYAVPNVPHFWVVIYVERWKKPDGSLLDYKIVAKFGTGLIDTVTTMRQLTYDLDLRNGTTVIVGANSGDARFQTMPNWILASGKTVTPVGKVYWLNNHAAFHAIEHQRTPTEAMYYRSTGMGIPVIKSIVPTQLPPTIESAYDVTDQNDGISRLLTYQPFANGGIRIDLDAVGGFMGEPAMHPVHSLYWLNAYHGNTANARKWEQNQRVAASHTCIFPMLGSGIFEPTTMYVPNPVPASDQAFTGMTPTRQNTNAEIIPVDNTYGRTDPMQTLSGVGSIASVSHAINYTYGAYLLGGEQHQLDDVIHASINPSWGRNPKGRIVTIGANTFHGCVFDYSSHNCRIAFRKSRADMYAAAVAPLTWADGTTNQETALLRYCAKGFYDMWNTLIPYVGSAITDGDGVTHTKAYDYSGTGVWPREGVEPGDNDIGSSTFFMEFYGFEIVCHGAWINQGTPFGDAIAAWRDYHAIAMVGAYGAPGSHFQVQYSYRKRNQIGPLQSPPINMSNGYLPASPTIAGSLKTWNYPYFSHPYINFQSGSSDVTIDYGGIWLWGSTSMGDGSRILLTTDDPETLYANACPPPPSPYVADTNTWYYWLQGANPAIGKLCTGLDGLGNPDPATAAVASATVTGCGWWAVISNGWADNAAVFDLSGYTPQFIGVTRLAKALGLPAIGGLRDAAITNTDAIATAGSLTAYYTDNIKWAMDKTLD